MSASDSGSSSPFASVRGAVRRDQGPGVAQHKEIARLGLHQQVRRDAGIGAGDQQRLRLLPLRKAREQFAMRAEGRSLEVVNASNKFFHNRSPSFDRFRPQKINAGGPRSMRTMSKTFSYLFLREITY